MSSIIFPEATWGGIGRGRGYLKAKDFRKSVTNHEKITNEHLNFLNIFQPQEKLLPIICKVLFPPILHNCTEIETHRKSRLWMENNINFLFVYSGIVGK